MNVGVIMVRLNPCKNPLVEALHHALTTHVPAGAQVAVGLSGGMDSTCLLHAISSIKRYTKLNLDFFACHVNHGISPRAADWENFCRQICRDKGIDITVLSQPNATVDNEAQARELRYDCFAQLKADIIILAHHLDDQIETLLFRLLRGAGIKGMAAMQEKKVLSGKTILRPWLHIDKKTLQQYATSCQLQWIEDEDNFNLSHSRNAIRHRLLPLIDKLMPQSKKRLAVVQNNLSQAALLLSELADIDEHNANQSANDKGNNKGLSLSYFKQIGEHRTRNYLYHYLSAHHLPYTDAQLYEIVRQLWQAPPTKQLTFSFGSQNLHLSNGLLYFKSNNVP